MLVTQSIIQKLCPRLDAGRARDVADTLNDVCPLYGIKSADIMHEFLANLLHECIGFTRFEENLNYSAEAIMRTWPTRFVIIDEAKKFARNPKALAMKVYGKRRDLGNISEEDGWTFRGSGPIQATGRGNLTAFAAYMEKRFGVDKLPEQWAAELRTSLHWGVHSACWIFAISKTLIDEAINDDMLTIIRRINGGLNGLGDRMNYYKLCKRLIV